jgi:Type VI secretion system/phage-baseplate injector OB domain
MMLDDDLRALIADRLLGRFYGKYEGVVSANADPKGLGRIRAYVPAVLGPDVQSGWALPCAVFGGGKERGLIAVPEVNDTVWIEFAGGDPSRPIWAGAFWGAPSSTGAEGDLGAEAGNEVPTADGSARGGPGRLVLRTKSGHRLYADDDAGIVAIVAGDDGAEVRIDAEGVITISAGTIKLGASAGQKLVLGDAFMQLFNSHIHPTGVGNSGPPNPRMESSHLSQVSTTE